MKSFEYDLRYLQAGLDVIEDYLPSSEVFWPLSANPPEGVPEYPRLTLGGMLLSKVRLSAYAITHMNKKRCGSKSFQNWTGRITKWREAWENKARRSFSVRLRMWTDYIEEYKSNPQENADRYSYEVRLMVMLRLLSTEGGGQPQAELNLLSGLDGYLESLLKKDSFI